MPTIVFDAIVILERAAEDIEGAAYGEVHAALTGVANGVQIRQLVGSAGVGNGDLRVCG